MHMVGRMQDAGCEMGVQTLLYARAGQISGPPSWVHTCLEELPGRQTQRGRHTRGKGRSVRGA